MIHGTAVELQGAHNYTDFRESFVREISNKRFRNMYFEEPVAVPAPSWAHFYYAPAKANGARAWLQQYTSREIQVAEFQSCMREYMKQQQLVSDAMRFLISRLSVDVFAGLSDWSPPHSPKILWDLLFARYGSRADEPVEATAQVNTHAMTRNDLTD